MSGAVLRNLPVVPRTGCPAWICARETAKAAVMKIRIMSPEYVRTGRQLSRLFDLQKIRSSNTCGRGEHEKNHPLFGHHTDRSMGGNRDGEEAVDMGAHKLSLPYVGYFNNDCCIDLFDVAILNRYWLTQQDGRLWH